MNRRDFLKLGGVFSTAALLRINPQAILLPDPVEAAAGNKLYRGTPDGKIFISEDGGGSWQLHANFGNDCSILDLLANSNERVFARVGFKQHSFVLMLSKNGKNWQSATGQRAV